MSFPQYPMVNGYEPSFSSIEVTFTSTGIVLPVPGIKAISYQDPLTRATIYGNSVSPIGRTRGQLKPAGSIEFYQRTWSTVLLQLTGNGLWGFSEQTWTISVIRGEVGFTPTVDVLTGVSIHSPDSSNTEGTEASVVKCTLDILDILWGGVNKSLSSVITG